MFLRQPGDRPGHHVKWRYERGGSISAVSERWRILRAQDFGIDDRGHVPGSDISYGINTPQFVSHYEVTVQACFWTAYPFTVHPESWVSVASLGSGAVRQ